MMSLVLAISAASVQAGSLPEFTELVERHSAAVVNISTTQITQHPKVTRMPRGMPEQIPEGPFGDLFRHFFGDPRGGFGGPEGQMPEGHGAPGGPDGGPIEAKSLGSGFIISKDGYVMTNHHVVKDASEILVRLSDRRELVAEVIGSDERSDIALLKVDASDLPVVEIGDSGKLKVGAWVLAIGSPFGFDHSVTAGIVSAKGRSLPRENYVPFIQTDVAINPGNSGGPLFDLDGKVIGINSQIYSRTGGFMGLSFAIPIDMAMNVVAQLKASGHVARGWLGVLIQDVTRELAESFGMDKPSGALVAKVLKDSPAEAAGLEVGDIVTRFNGRDVVHSSDLPPLVGISPVGDKVKVEILRKGKLKVMHVKLGELPEDEIKVAEASPRSANETRLSVAVIDLTAEQREKLEIKDGGVIVQQVQAGPARKAGVRRGDVILMINNIDVKDSQHFAEISADLPVDKSVPLLVQRRGGPVFLALKITADE
ncbi:MAG: DegQ family serine endoprotease [Gammaproteobacteria bacterium]|nr:DegQ family serine endoprotease [Gammaproteobacteria bacterium]